MSLQHAWQELAPHWPATIATPFVEPLADTTAIVMQPPSGATACRLIETRQRLFLMQLCNVELHFQVPLQIERGARVSLHYRGWLRRGALTCSEAADAEIVRAARRVCADRNVQQTLLHIDFTQFELIGQHDALLVRLALYGGSEVRSRLPGLQRYVGLGVTQARALSAAADAVSRALMSL